MKTTAAALAVLAVLVAACSNADSITATQAKVIEIASELPLADGPEAKRAVDAAIAEHPTVRGYSLVHRSLDDSLGGRWNKDRALQNAKLMVREAQILGVVGPWNSLSVKLVVPVAGQESLAMISPSATLDCLTASPTACLNWPDTPSHANNFFRVVAGNSVGARAIADFVTGKLGVKRFAVIPFNDERDQAIGEVFRSELELKGGKVVFGRTYSPTDPTFAPLLRQAREAGAEAVYVPWGHTDDHACRVRADMSGIFPTDAYFFSGDSICAPECITQAGGEGNEHLVGTIAARLPALSSLKGTSLATPSANLLNSGPYGYGAYDAARILIAAIDRSIVKSGGKYPTRQQVLNEVAATKDFKGITGTYSFDANGDPIQPGVSFYHVTGGNWTWWQNFP